MRARRGRRPAPDTLPRPAHWTAQAACIGAPPEIFHPPQEAGLTQVVAREAKAWCARCPVQARCLAEALERAEPHGVWGGLDAGERRTVLRRQRERERNARRRAEQAEEVAAGDGTPEPTEAT
ncbi:WhiB family transcriptional regulator [Streptomyces sp. S399]|uniref:WhiB family transcriptional regulator n=1 Tax=Streptomyces sp. S399 TaxID=3096009 RepID=UPI002A7F4094|nr:WhiB family transcriptional regulator [Streptomyces sp. S399]WPR52786.1 WhiB family transcriptional regulator [Streptomyces sp. S399]